MRTKELTTAEFRTKIWNQYNALKPPSGFDCCPFLGGATVIVDSLFIAAPIVCVGSVFGPCFAM